MPDMRSSSHDWSMSEQLNRRDLEVILEVNKKAIEIETCVADQNEEMIASQNTIKEIYTKLDAKCEKIIAQNDQLSRELFKLQVSLVMGLLAIVAQIIQFFLKK
jgi:hypothetical protein